MVFSARVFKAGIGAGLVALIMRYCVTTERNVQVERFYRPATSEFEVKGPLKIVNDPVMHVEDHFYSVQPETKIEGAGVASRIPRGNEHGQDVVLYFIEPSASDTYVAKCRTAPDACDLAFYSEHMKAVMLVGATDALTAELRSPTRVPVADGAPVAYEGRYLDYKTSTLDGKDTPRDPPDEELESHDPRFVARKFKYFLVTGIK